MWTNIVWVQFLAIDNDFDLAYLLCQEKYMMLSALLWKSQMQQFSYPLNLKQKLVITQICLHFHSSTSNIQCLLFGITQLCMFYYFCLFQLLSILSWANICWFFTFFRLFIILYCLELLNSPCIYCFCFN